MAKVLNFSPVPRSTQRRIQKCFDKTLWNLCIGLRDVVSEEIRTARRHRYVLDLYNLRNDLDFAYRLIERDLEAIGGEEYRAERGVRQ